MKFLDNNTLKFVLLVLLIALAIGLGPILTLLALNALFQLNIAYTIGNWLAVAWLSILFLPKHK